MRPNPSLVRLAVYAALGVVAVAPVVQAAPVLPNGVYQATINPTPLTTPTPTALVFPGTDGAWNSTFSFSHLPTKKSQAMEDNKFDFTCGAPSGTCGSSVLGKGAGSWTMTVNGGTFTASNFQVDSIPGTAGGTFVEYGSIKGGTIDQTTGAMTLDTTGRLGSVSNYKSSLFDEPWNIPDSGTTYKPLTTGASTNTGTTAGTYGTITGHDIVPIAGTSNYNVILVSASNVGKAWGGFDTDPYMETWNVNLTPLLIVKDDTAAAQPGVAKLIDVEKNDTIASGVTSTIVLLPSTETNGATLAVSSGKVSYTAPLTFTGTDTFQYKLKDSQGDTTAPATVVVTVAAVVTAVADTAHTPEGQPVTIDVLANDSGVNGATVTVKVTQPAAHGSTTLSGSKVIYTPNPGYVGTDTFQYTATVSGKSSAATVTVTVKAAFQAATSGVSVGPGAIATKEGSSGLVTTSQLKTAGIPPDSGVSSQCIGGCFDFKATLPSGVTQATVAMLRLSKPIPSGAKLRKYIGTKWQDFAISPGNSMAFAPGSATSCPPPSSTKYQSSLTPVAGDYCVRLTITDGGKNDGDGSANGTITDLGGIATGTGTSGPVAPVVKNDTASTPEGQPVMIDVLQNDSGVSGATVTIPTSPAHGNATVNKNQVVYTPKSGYVGTDTFQYAATVSGKSSTATVTVTMKAAFQAATSGVSVGPGAIAAKDGSAGLVTTPQLVAAGISADSGVSSQCIGGCFDFKATGVKSGGQAKVVMLPLTKPIPSGAKLRKYISGGWQDFVTSNGDSVASALGSKTSCPSSSASYKSGLHAGDYCVQLTIKDGGKNDSDGLANGVIIDPSGIATGTGSSGSSGTSGSSSSSNSFGGCALGTDANPWHGGSWWLIGGMIGWLGFTRRRRSSRRA